MGVKHMKDKTKKTLKVTGVILVSLAVLVILGFLSMRQGYSAGYENAVSDIMDEMSDCGKGLKLMHPNQFEDVTIYSKACDNSLDEVGQEINIDVE
jgi:hypothetical protein